MAIYEPESRLSPDTECAGTLSLDFPASRTVRNYLLFLTRPEAGKSESGVFVTAGQTAYLAPESSGGPLMLPPISHGQPERATAAQD